jgi:hypothetical protein
MKGRIKARDLKKVLINLAYGGNAGKAMRLMQRREWDQPSKPCLKLSCHWKRTVAVCPTMHDPMANSEKRRCGESIS